MEQTLAQRILRLGIAPVLGVVVLLVFLPWVILTGKNERDSRQAIEGYDPFTLPEFPIKFSRTMKFDPLGFMGKGMQAGFWRWTPTGMELAEGGRAYFAETPTEIASLVGAGRREVSKIEGFRDREGKREVHFRYRWSDVALPARTLLSKSPIPNQEYEGRAVLVQQEGRWRVERLETPDFDRPLALLKDTVAEIRR